MRWSLEIELAAAHKEITLGARANIFALLIHQSRITERAEVPPVFFRWILAWLRLVRLDFVHEGSFLPTSVLSLK